jgi:hypothetical protein
MDQGGDRRGVNRNPIKFLARIGLCPDFKTSKTSALEDDESIFQQDKNDPNEIMKPTKEEWDQSDL